ncbi:chorismate pyruvate-lyase family protein [Aurantivibrio plasticivorans]
MPSLHANDASLSLFQEILLTTDGTVTDLIALYTGSPIHITKIQQSVVNHAVPTSLQVDPQSDVLHREILLSGDDKHYLYAESHFVISRMSEQMQSDLLHTDTPIGLLWKQARLETYREIIDSFTEPMGKLAPYFSGDPSDRLRCRSYLIHHNTLPLGLITEKFPASFFT